MFSEPVPFWPKGLVEVKYQDIKSLRWCTIALIVWDGCRWGYLIHDDLKEIPFIEAIGTQVSTWIQSGIPTVPDPEMPPFSEAWWDQLRRIQKWPIHFGPVQYLDPPGKGQVH